MNVGIIQALKNSVLVFTFVFTASGKGKSLWPSSSLDRAITNSSSLSVPMNLVAHGSNYLQIYSYAPIVTTEIGSISISLWLKNESIVIAMKRFRNT